MTARKLIRKLIFGVNYICLEEWIWLCFNLRKNFTAISKLVFRSYDIYYKRQSSRQKSWASYSFVPSMCPSVPLWTRQPSGDCMTIAVEEPDSVLRLFLRMHAGCPSHCPENEFLSVEMTLTVITNSFFNSNLWQWWLGCII